MGNRQSTQEDHRAAGGAVAADTHDSVAEDAAAKIFEAQGLSSRCDLSISIDNLVKTVFRLDSDVDPMVVVYQKISATSLEEIGRTEPVANSESPRFVSLIDITYRFEEVQVLVFKVFNVTSSALGQAPLAIDLSRQQLLCECSCPLASIMGASGQSYKMALTNTNQQNRTTLTVVAEERANQNAVVRLRMRAEGCDKKRSIGSANPFLKFHRVKESATGTTLIPCFKSEVRNNSLNPIWSVAEISVPTLCNGDFYRPLHIQCLDWESDGKHELIGEAILSLDTIIQRSTQESKNKRLNRFPLINNEVKRKKGAGYVDSGELIFEECTLVSRPSFLDYIEGGTEIAFSVAIDFTASNGPPSSATSLHHIDPTGNRMNSYQHAIMSVGHVLEFYDTDKNFPVWGFGAQASRGSGGAGVTSHCFALNGNDSNPEVAGIQGVMDAYNAAIRVVQLSGPTVFAQVINASAAQAAAAQSDPGSKYFILLIITDGAINDMDNTISSIIQAAMLPMSILIVGVGHADFSAMDVLDGDEVRLHNITGTASRDIVQFVPMRDFVRQDGSVDDVVIAKQLLEEIPCQFLEYMQQRGIVPKQKRGVHGVASNFGAV